VPRFFSLIRRYASRSLASALDRPARQRFLTPPAKRPTLEALEDRLVPAGTWQSLNPTNPGAGPPGTEAVMLLSDGTVAVQGGVNDGSTSAAWYRLTPNNTGSYVRGTWSTLASMNDERLFFTTPC